MIVWMIVWIGAAVWGPAVWAGVILNGAGATFPNPLYQKWIEVYERSNPVRITYQPVGSGAGTRELMARQVDFGGGDVFLKAGIRN